MESVAEHRSFELTGGWRITGILPECSLQGVIPVQVGLGLIWLLSWGLTLADTGGIDAWLPLNYVLFDLYLVLRGRFRGATWGQSSRPTRIFLQLSPLLMLPTSFVLGMLGTGLHGGLFQ